MEQKGTVQIETERLILRKFRMSDAKFAFENWENDSRVTEFLSWQPYKSIKNVKKFIRQVKRWYLNKNTYFWTIVLKEINQPIGSIDGKFFEQVNHVKKVRIGYCIGYNWWHKGIMSEALSAIIKFFFEEVGANRIEAFHDPNNPNSGKVMQKCGMTYEGTLRQSIYSNKGVTDACIYSILASEYFEKKN